MTGKSQKEDNLKPSKRCEYMGEFFSPDANNPLKICAYKCKGYNALATFPWDKNKPCPPSFESNFPGT